MQEKKKNQGMQPDQGNLKMQPDQGNFFYITAGDCTLHRNGLHDMLPRADGADAQTGAELAILSVLQALDRDHPFT